MANEKKMDETAFSSIVREIAAVGELIRTNQDKKQTVIDDFGRERKRYHAGKISKKALGSSARKVNKELTNLDKSIRKNISLLGKVGNTAKKFAARQNPRAFRASVTGIRTSSKKHR
ncbi:hypothetical protein KW805_03635 [Candidatus Pacearchaeota archaeon]|nr:hypothetical protein [Candidatus Pacearchaeota archaeon]